MLLIVLFSTQPDCFQHVWPHCVRTTFWHWLHVWTNSFKTSPWTDVPDIIQSSCLKGFYLYWFFVSLCVYSFVFMHHLLICSTVFQICVLECWMEKIKHGMTAIMKICRDSVDFSWKQLPWSHKTWWKHSLKGGTPRPLDAAEHKWYLCHSKDAL